MILGTLGYMSPEQVRGESVDARSDLFSFGVVLFEMLTGKRAFARDTAADTLAAILKEDPLDISESSRPIPPGLLRVLHHCLEKESEERFQSARDLAFDLQSVSGSGMMGVPTLTTDLLGHRKWLAAGSAVVLLAGAVVGSFGLGRRMGQRSAPAVTYHQRSFRPQAIFQAAFAPDGATIVYSAALQGHVPELFVIRPENPEPQSLGLPDTHLLSVSSRGELAVLTKASFLYHRLFQGTLARVPIGGAAPREILEGVTQADWSPDGSELAIIHAVDGKQRLEYPIGKVLLETAGYLSDLRVSPRGDRIAFIEHPVQSDDGGSAVIVDRVGRRTWKSGAYGMMAGQAWSPLGDELFFSATTIGIQETIFAVDLNGRQRIALSSAGGLTMHDVSRSGRWLATHDGIRYQISGLPPGAREEQDLSFLDACSQPHLSLDGHRMEFADESAAGGPNYSVCLRDTNGGPVLRLGPGQGFGLSPDGKRALAVVYAESQVVLYPTGPGEPLRLPRGPLQAYHGAAWFPDGKRVLLVGNEPGKASRCYEQDLVGGLPHPLTPEGTNNGRVSPDGRQILYMDSAGVWFLQPTEGGTARAVSGLGPEDRVQHWSQGDGGLYVFGSNDMPRRLERLDLATGHRTTVRLIAPTDRTGALWVIRLSLSDDAKAYAYSYNRMISQLFVVEGAR
jgi:Tol biopolymer transport system component